MEGMCSLHWHWGRARLLCPEVRGAQLSGCLQREWMQFGIWKEQALGLVFSPSAVRVRGNLPSPGAPLVLPGSAATRDVPQLQMGSS